MIHRQQKRFVPHRFPTAAHQPALIDDLRGDAVTHLHLPEVFDDVGGHTLRRHEDERVRLAGVEETNARLLDTEQIAGALRDRIQNLLGREAMRDRLLDTEQSVEQALSFPQLTDEAAVVGGTSLEILARCSLRGERGAHTDRHTQHTADRPHEPDLVSSEVVGGANEQDATRFARQRGGHDPCCPEARELDLPFLRSGQLEEQVIGSIGLTEPELGDDAIGSGHRRDLRIERLGKPFERRVEIEPFGRIAEAGDQLRQGEKRPRGRHAQPIARVTSVWLWNPEAPCTRANSP